MKLLEQLPYELDRGLAGRASFGLIVLATDCTIEYEWRRIFGQVAGAALYHSRIRNADRVTPASLRAMAPRITASAALFTPGTPVDVVAYGCTSASMAIGEQTVFDKIRKAQPGARCTTPSTAAGAAFAAFGARRIGVLTPYSAAVNRIVADCIASRGYAVPVFGSFNQERDSLVARISPQSIAHGVRELMRHAAVDAVFVSCTAVRLVDACRDLETRIGIPLTSSNHALAWHALRLGGIADQLPEFGSLFTLPLAAAAPST